MAAKHSLSSTAMVAGLLLSPLLSSCTGDPGNDDPTFNLETELAAIPGVNFEEVESALDGYRQFQLTLTQPVESANPDGATFEQRLLLSHKSEDAPMVLFASGYFLPSASRLSEPAALLGANQLSVEHRYFYPSQPQQSDWTPLNIEEAADDFHRIVEAFKGIYPQAWIGTGGSKGGMTSIFHRRFYPDDMDGTVAYVAPISLAKNDERYLSFLDELGEPECQQALTTFQQTAILKKAEVMSLFAQYGSTTGLTYDFLGLEMAVEHAILETPFAFWQYYDASHCPQIPNPDAAPEAIFSFLDFVTGAAWFTDYYVYGFMPYFYQAATQFGYPAISEAAVADFLTFPGTDIAETYVDPQYATEFDPQSMVDILDWIDSDGSELLLLYGTWDPWTAAEIPLGGAQDSAVFYVETGNHLSSLSDLPDDEFEAATQYLFRWAGYHDAASKISKKLLSKRTWAGFTPEDHRAVYR